MIPAFVLLLLYCAPHPVLGFPTGLYPVGFEGRIHYTPDRRCTTQPSADDSGISSRSVWVDLIIFGSFQAFWRAHDGRFFSILLSTCSIKADLPVETITAVSRTEYRQTARIVLSHEIAFTDPSLRHDALSFGGAFAEPTVGPHVAQTWPLALLVGSIGGDALRASPPMAPTVQTAKRGTVWPFGRLEHWWLGSSPKLRRYGGVTTHK